MLDLLTRFYGLDWLASGLAIAMIWQLGSGKRIGFAFGMAANLSWVAFAAVTLSAPILIANLVFLALNIRGWRAWTNPKPQEEIT